MIQENELFKVSSLEPVSGTKRAERIYLTPWQTVLNPSLMKSLFIMSHSLMGLIVCFIHKIIERISKKCTSCREQVIPL